MRRQNIHAIAHLHARPDKTDELNALLTSLLEPTREETGCIRFELLQNRQSPTEFAIVSTWHDEQAVQHHIGTSHSQLEYFVNQSTELLSQKCIGLRDDASGGGENHEIKERNRWELK